VKFLFLFIFTTSAIYAFCEDPLIVTKKNRGLFGYKGVNETYAEGMHTLTCLDPGRTKCKPNKLIIDETLTLTELEFESIDRIVDDFVINHQREQGMFNYSDKAIITFSYNANRDELVYKIYSIKQASALGLI
jgi:hypothetical protein